MDEQSSLLTLFISSFLAATLLPGGSEAVLVGILLAYPELHWQALTLATVGNTLGGMSSYLIGRFLPSEKAFLNRAGGSARALDWIRQYGAPVLLFSWVPLVGDMLCVASGWLRTHWLWSILFIATGKFTRYWVVAKLIN